MADKIAKELKLIRDLLVAVQTDLANLKSDVTELKDGQIKQADALKSIKEKEGEQIDKMRNERNLFLRQARAALIEIEDRIIPLTPSRGRSPARLRDPRESQLLGELRGLDDEDGPAVPMN